MQSPALRSALRAMLVALLLCGCAAFRTGNLPEVEGWPPTTPSERKSISIVITGRLLYNGNERDLAPGLLQQWLDRAQRQFEYSNQFSKVEEGLAETDLRAELSIVDNGRGNLVLAFLTGLSMYVIPSTAADELIVKATFRNDQGDVVGEVTRSETVRLWQHVFLVFVAPFKMLHTVSGEAIDDLFRSVLFEATEKGYLR